MYEKLGKLKTINHVGGHNLTGKITMLVYLYTYLFIIKHMAGTNIDILAMKVYRSPKIAILELPANQLSLGSKRTHVSYVSHR